MRMQTPLIVGAALLAIGAWTFWPRAPDAASGDKQEPVAVSTGANGVGSSISTERARPAQVLEPNGNGFDVRKPHVQVASAASTAALRAQVAAAYACADCDADSPFVAQSPAEGAWMSTRGFPSQAQLQNMQGLDRSVLRARADQGNTVAAGLLGTILLKEGIESEGRNYLAKARQHGSIYALYSLSEWMRSERNPTPDLYLAATYIRLAYLLGDTNAAHYLYTNFPNMDRYALMGIDRQASAILRRMQFTNPGRATAQSSDMVRPDPKEDAYLQDFDWNQ